MDFYVILKTTKGRENKINYCKIRKNKTLNSLLLLCVPWHNCGSQEIILWSLFFPSILHGLQELNSGPQAFLGSILAPDYKPLLDSSVRKQTY